MRLSGTCAIAAPREAVWAFLLAPDRLRACLPGCERFEAAAPDRFEATLRLGVAFVKGVYSGTVHVVDERFPEHLTLLVQGGGSLGSLTAAGALTLAARGGSTYLTYDGDATVSGYVASVGERLISATAERLLAAFFDCVAAHVAQ